MHSYQYAFLLGMTTVECINPRQPVLSHFLASVPILYGYYFSFQKYILVHIILKILLHIHFLVVKIFWSRKYIFVSINHIWFFRLFWESSRSWVYIMVLVMKSACLKTGQVVCKPAENFPSVEKKSDPGIEINDDINVKVYFSSVKTINLINKHLLSWPSELKNNDNNKKKLLFSFKSMILV